MPVYTGRKSEISFLRREKFSRVNCNLWEARAQTSKLLLTNAFLIYLIIVKPSAVIRQFGKNISHYFPWIFRLSAITTALIYQQSNTKECFCKWAMEKNKKNKKRLSPKFENLSNTLIIFWQRFRVKLHSFQFLPSPIKSVRHFDLNMEIGESVSRTKIAGFCMAHRFFEKILFYRIV